MPEGLKMFPAYLKEAGYYTANSSKTDYNCIMPDGTWDNDKGKPDEWRNRLQKEMPFFFVHSNGRSHESSLHLILGDITYMKDYLKNTTFHIEANSIPFSAENIQWRLEYINSRHL